MMHDLKTWQQFYKQVKSGRKNFEFRANDRGYQCGDYVTLMEYDPTKTQILDIDGKSVEKEIGYTGDELKFKIGYVLPINAEYVVFSLLPVGPTELMSDGNEIPF